MLTFTYTVLRILQNTHLNQHKIARGAVYLREPYFSFLSKKQKSSIHKHETHRATIETFSARAIPKRQNPM